MEKYITIRAITPDECSWLDKTVLAGTIVTGSWDSYGACSPTGIMVEYEGSHCPTELPADALRPYEENLN